MNSLLEFNLTLMLFLPWFAILATMFCCYPRLPRGLVRRGFDLATLVLAITLSWLGMRWGMLNADVSAGAIWKQVLACLMAYAAFLGVLGIAGLLRALLLRGHLR